MILRPYQQRVIDQLYQWWMARPGIDETPLCVVPTGGGKAVIIAELTRLLFDTWPEDHPRTLVLVPSKELAEQNAEKLAALLPSHIRLGYYSAAIGKKQADADVIVATIGSIYREAHRIGNIKCVIIDEAHLVNPSGAEAGRYRALLTDLAKTCSFRVVGLTATPFRGDGVWLTDGEAPLFSGIASTVTVQELLDAGFLSPLVRPADVIETRIDTAGIKTASGDFNIAELSERVDGYLPAVAAEAVRLAADRRKWIAFTATVQNADHLVELLRHQGVAAALVCGETPKAERATLIAAFRAGEIRCLVTVLALATGFDVPDVDCVIWCRPTKSPVLYVQGAGRGLRIAEGKTDCLWLDFSDTTERLGPVDAIKGRKKRTAVDREAPYAICDECGERVTPASLLECPHCGAILREEEKQEARAASNAPVMAHQAAPRLVTYPVTRVGYAIHRKEGKPDSLRVDYYSGLRRVASEWVCFDHGGFARAKAESWWKKRMRLHYGTLNTELAYMHLDLISRDKYGYCQPAAIVVNEISKYPEIVSYQWSSNEQIAA